MTEKILDILKGSLKPLQSKEIVTLLKEIHKVNIKQYQVRDILWGDLKDDVVYRGKPHWDYRLKEAIKIDLNMVKVVNYINILDQPLCSIQISYQRNEIIYYINKASPHYSVGYEPVIVLFLDAWAEMLMKSNSAVDFFYEYVTMLK
jgi:hypothetical protein